MEDLFLPSRLGRIHCRAVGAGPILFLMHSVGRSAHEFDALAQLLSDRFRVVAWDMPGHGDSDRLRGPVSIVELADLAVELALSLSLPAPSSKPVIAGGSIGAAIALAAAARHGDVLGGIIPIELPLSRDQSWWQQNWPLIEAMFGCPEEPDERVRSRYRRLTPDLAHRLTIDRHKAGCRGMMSVLWAGREDADATRLRITELAIPALFVNGSAGVAPEAAEVLAAYANVAELTVVTDSGHFPHTDDPDAVAEAILTWSSAK